MNCKQKKKYHFHQLLSISAASDFFDHKFFAGQQLPFPACAEGTDALVLYEIEYFAAFFAEGIAGQYFDFEFGILHDGAVNGTRVACFNIFGYHR